MCFLSFTDLGPKKTWAEVITAFFSLLMDLCLSHMFGLYFIAILLGLSNHFDATIMLAAPLLWLLCLGASLSSPWFPKWSTLKDPDPEDPTTEDNSMSGKHRWEKKHQQQSQRPQLETPKFVPSRLCRQKSKGRYHCSKPPYLQQQAQYSAAKDLLHRTH
jgi:hypothetical protein